LALILLWVSHHVKRVGIAFAIRNFWDFLAKKPLGKLLFSRISGLQSPYTGTVRPYVREIRAGFAEVDIAQRWRISNPFKSIHLAAVINAGEFASGLSVMYAMENKNSRTIPTKITSEFYKKSFGKVTAQATTPLPLPTDIGSHEVASEVKIFSRGEPEEILAKLTIVWKLSNFAEKEIRLKSD